MAALNRGAIVTAVSNLGGFDSTSGNPLTRLQQLLVSAEATVWGAADWIFKKAGPTAITYPTTGIVALPTDFGSSLQLLDDVGDPLLALEPNEFDRVYQEDIDNLVRASRPEAYKVVNRVVQVAPLPAASVAAKMSYTRRQSHFASDGTTVVAGEMTTDTDLPMLPSVHHMVLVWCLLTLAGIAGSDTSSILWDQSYDVALQAAVDELTGTDIGIGGAVQYGRDRL